MIADCLVLAVGSCLFDFSSLSVHSCMVVVVVALLCASLTDLLVALMFGWLVGWLVGCFLSIVWCRCLIPGC